MSVQMDTDACKVIFVNQLSVRDWEEATVRGYLSHVLVQIGAKLYPLTFYDIGRFNQQFQDSTKHSEKHFAESGLIVLDTVCQASIDSAISSLYGDGHFNYLMPISKEDLETSNPYEWPPTFAHPSRAKNQS